MKSFDFFNKIKSREDLEGLMLLQHEEMKQRHLLSNAAPTTDDLFHSGYSDFIIEFCGMIPPACRKRGSKVLDIGCGEGRLLNLLNSLGFETHGVDAYVFDGLNTKAEPRGPLIKKYFSEKQIHVEKIDLMREILPFPDNYFDIVTCTEVIEHFHNSPKKCFQEMKRVLKNDGYILLTTPNYASLKNRINAVFGKSNHCKIEKFYNYNVTIPPNTDFVGHFREFTLGEVKKMLIWESLKIRQAITFDVSYKGMILRLLKFLQCAGPKLKSNIFISAQK